jgi:hypothetical protein
LYLARFRIDSVHIEVGKSYLVDVYLRNPDLAHGYISAWLGGDYLKGSAKFTPEPGIVYSSDMRNLTVGLNPWEGRVVRLVIVSTTVPSWYSITLDSNTTANPGRTDFQTLGVKIDNNPAFPGLETFSIILLLAGCLVIFFKKIPGRTGRHIS